jgi:hypothetical protein
MLEYFNDILYIKRAGTLLKMILFLAIHHHLIFKEIISHACYLSQAFTVTKICQSNDTQEAVFFTIN